MFEVCRAVSRKVVHRSRNSGRVQLTYLRRYWGVFWVDASSDENAQQGFVKIAELCGLENKTSDQARYWLSATKHSSLLVIDNADDPTNDYSRYFPAGDRGHILLTSRVKDCSDHSTIGSEAFEGLDPDDAARLLLKASRIDQTEHQAKQDAAESVVKLLAFHALAIIQAGAYISHKYCSLEKYPEEFRSQRQRLLKYQQKQNVATYGNVYATFESSAKVLEDDLNPEAGCAFDLLNILAFLYFERVPESIFARAWTESHKHSDAGSLIRDARKSDITRLSDWHNYHAHLPEFMT